MEFLEANLESLVASANRLRGCTLSGEEMTLRFGNAQVVVALWQDYEWPHSVGWRVLKGAKWLREGGHLPTEEGVENMVTFTTFTMPVENEDEAKLVQIEYGLPGPMEGMN